MKQKSFFTPLNMALIGVMTALGTVIYMVFPEVPLVPGVEYLKIDFSDVPAILVGVTVNPLCGIFVEMFKNLIHLFKTSTFGVGELMNVGIGSVVILSLWGGSKLFSKLYKKLVSLTPLHESKLFSSLCKQDMWHPLSYFSAAVVTVAATILCGWLLNWLLTPVFYAAMGWPLTPELLTAGVFGSTALNAVKAAINILPFYPLYYAMAKLVRRMS